MSESPVERAAVSFAAFPDSGYYILAHGDGRLIADFGGPGESPNPGHQHAGIFSYELSIGGCRVVVDSGTPSYDAGKERQRARSTAAHNTIRIDGADQYELWKSFRAGRRAWVSAVMQESRERHAWISAAHDGFERLGVEHRRAIAVLDGSGWVVIDWITASGSHGIESYIHLHPDLEVRPSAGECVLSETGYSVIGPAGGRFEIREDLYSPRLGQRIPATTLVRAEDVAFGPRRATITWVYGLLASPAKVKTIWSTDRSSIGITTPSRSWTIAAETNGLLRITGIQA